MARIDLEPRPTLPNRIFRWMSRRMTGADLDPVAAVCHNPAVMWGYGITPLQRRVMEFAELLSGEVDDVPDELVARLRDDLGERALVELAMMVAVENQRSRFNSALGLTSQGFRATCEVR